MNVGYVNYSSIKLFSERTKRMRRWRETKVRHFWFEREKAERGRVGKDMNVENAIF